MREIRDKTTKWLWHLAPSHMKEGNKPDAERDSYKLFSIWAKNAENFKTKAYEVRRNRFPQWATPDALNLLGKERGIKPLKGEDLEDFRTRVVNALKWWQLAGTVKGLKTIFELLGFTDVEIKEVLKEDPERWAEFSVKISSPSRQITPQLRDSIIELINQLKPAHEKLAELILSYLAQGHAYWSAGSIGEQTAYTKFQREFTQITTGTTYWSAGSLGEQTAYARFEQ